MARFDKRWFNPLYFILNDIFKINSIRTVLIYGGKSSSKTVSICQQLVKQCYVAGANALAFRKESTTIPTTIKKTFNLAIDGMYLYPAYTKQDRRYLCENEHGNVSEIVLKGLDDEEKAKGTESYKFVYLDELNHFLQGEYDQFNLSLRGIPGQKIIASWNPVDENSWVKAELVDAYDWQETDWELPCSASFVKISSCGKAILIKTTYEDNYWIAGSPDGLYGYRDENLIAEYEAMRTKNYNSYKVNVLGEWGKTDYGGEFLKQWRSETHVKIYPYNPTLAVYLYFDENVNPYFPCGFFQLDGKAARLIHVLALSSPDNTVSAMTRAIASKLKAWGHSEAVFVGGDPASKKEDVKLEKGNDLFKLIIDRLQDWRPRRAVLQSAPSVRDSADFFNAVLGEELYGITFGVDKSCGIAISDYENTKEDKNGKVDKRTITNPKTKVSYQPWGHFVDLTRYFMCYAFKDEYAKYLKGSTSKIPQTGKNYSKNVY